MSSSSAELYVGVDGAATSTRSHGWVAVAIGRRGFVRASYHPVFREVVEAYPAPSVLAVDIPIGLTREVSRQADVAARRVLGPRAASVFPAPVRPVLAAESYEEACAVSAETCGRKLSRQVWGLVPRIREVDRYCRERRIHEVHPEVSFRLLGAVPLRLSKKTWGGQAERRQRLAAAGIVVPDELGEAGAVAADDVLDAAAAAWTARRIASGEALVLPEGPAQRDRGRSIVIRA